MELRLELALSTGSDPVPHRTENPSFAGDETKLRKSPFSNRNGKAKEGFVVGWPPVKSWRKQLRQHNRRLVENGNGGGGRWRRSMYVKVKMEGVGITRKIDLSSHLSHRTLSPKLISLFGKCEESGKYTLMYQNKEGEWLQAEDVTWDCFRKSVHRLKLEKLNGC